MSKRKNNNSSPEPKRSKSPSFLTDHLRDRDLDYQVLVDAGFKYESARGSFSYLFFDFRDSKNIVMKHVRYEEIENSDRKWSIINNDKEAAKIYGSQLLKSIDRKEVEKYPDNEKPILFLTEGETDTETIVCAFKQGYVLGFPGCQSVAKSLHVLKTWWKMFGKVVIMKDKDEGGRKFASTFVEHLNNEFDQSYLDRVEILEPGIEGCKDVNDVWLREKPTILHDPENFGKWLKRNFITMEASFFLPKQTINVALIPPTMTNGNSNSEVGENDIQMVKNIVSDCLNEETSRQIKKISVEKKKYTTIWVDIGYWCPLKNGEHDSTSCKLSLTDNHLKIICHAEKGHSDNPPDFHDSNGRPTKQLKNLSENDADRIRELLGKRRKEKTCLSLEKFKEDLFDEDPEEAVKINWNHYSSFIIAVILDGKMAEVDEENRSLKKSFKILTQYLNQFIVMVDGRNLFFMRMEIGLPYLEFSSGHIKEMLDDQCPGLYRKYINSKKGVVKISKIVWQPESEPGLLFQKNSYVFNVFWDIDVKMYENSFPEVSMEKMEEKLEPLLTIFRKTICGDSEEVEEFMTRHIADILVHKKQTCHVIMLLGLNGVGKSLFVKILDKMIGSHLSAKANISQVGDKYNSFIGRKLLVYCEEGLKKLQSSAWEQIKDDATSEIVIVQDKYIKSSAIETRVNYIFLGNEPTKLNVDDRRTIDLTASSELAEQAGKSKEELDNIWKIKNQVIRLLKNNSDETWETLVYFYRWLKSKHPVCNCVDTGRKITFDQVDTDTYVCADLALQYLGRIIEKEEWNTDGDTFYVENDDLLFIRSRNLTNRMREKLELDINIKLKYQGSFRKAGGNGKTKLRYDMDQSRAVSWCFKLSPLKKYLKNERIL